MAVRIAVCVKVVPRSAVPLRLDPDTHRLDRTGPAELNPPDLSAIEEALRVREREQGDITLVAMTPADGVESLRAGLAMGADRAIVVTDPAIVGSDVLGTSRVLASVIAAEGFDLVVFGALSVDGSGGMLAAAVAARRGWPVASGLTGVVLEDGRARGSRQVEGGEQVVEAKLPAVVAIAGSPNLPRYPSFRDIVAAKKIAIETRSLADLGIDPAEVGDIGSRTVVRSVAAAPARRVGGEVRDDDGHGAEWLAAGILERLA